MSQTKKLIEVALPLDAINSASELDKRPESGAYHPKGLHHWWARLPLPAARAILFASLVDDPSCNEKDFHTESSQNTERERLFDIIRKLCQTKIHTRLNVFEDAFIEINKHCNANLPTVFDPFSGGGTIPLEGMRLGLPVLASDLNPVAVIINKVQLEILPEFANQPPINPPRESNKALQEWNLGKGIADDVKYYGNWINEEARRVIGNNYPKISIGNKEYPINVWIWARTVKCPNPSCGCAMPLVRSFTLSAKKKPNYFSQPIIERTKNGNNIIGYEVLNGTPQIKGTVNRSGAICIACNEAIKLNFIRDEGKAGRIDTVLIGMVINQSKGKVFISPNKEHESLAKSIKATWRPETRFPTNATRDIRAPLYGIEYHWQAFTERQLMGLDTLQDLIIKSKDRMIQDGAKLEYANALSVLLSLAISRLVAFNNSLTTWAPKGEEQKQIFARQAIPMVWDFPETNILENSGNCWLNALDRIAISIKVVLSTISKKQKAQQFDASKFYASGNNFIVSTDPPYYNNIGYSDLSDFFYVWLRRSLGHIYPDLFGTVLVPKMEELVASDFRYGSKEAAKLHFEEGFKKTFKNLISSLDSRFPLTVYYAFKQDEDIDGNEDPDNNSISLTTGWETMLEGLVSAGFQINATWPIKASQSLRVLARETNALTSYIVLACRPRSLSAASITRREYLQVLKMELPTAIKLLQNSNLAPVDLAQATIGPGMSIFSRYEKILEQDGTSMPVRTALSLINKSLAEILAEQEGDFDAETRWALSWFEQNEFESGTFGDANALALAKNTAVNALAHSGIVRSGAGKVQLIPRSELSATWNPESDTRVVIWEITQHLIKQLQEGGEIAAARLYKKIGPKGDIARELAYHLFTICEKKGWTQEATAYNSLVLSWNQIVAESYNIKDSKGTQTSLLD